MLRWNVFKYLEGETFLELKLVQRSTAATINYEENMQCAISLPPVSGKAQLEPT